MRIARSSLIPLVAVCLLVIAGCDATQTSSGDLPADVVGIHDEPPMGAPADMVGVSNGPPMGAVGGIEAVSWIARSYLERQAYVETHPFEVSMWEKDRFVPPEYADRVASCVAAAFDARQKDALGQVYKVSKQWRSTVSIVQDIRNSNVAQYTQDQIDQGKNLDEAIIRATSQCTRQLIPVGVFETAFQRHQEAINTANAQIWAERQRLTNEEDTRQRQAAVCQDALYHRNWYCNNGTGRSQDPSGEMCQQMQQKVASNGC